MNGVEGARSSWRSMIYRCQSPKCAAWEHYGGRGIVVCERWHVFANFLADMGERPDHHSIERDDVNGNYEPSNCRWIPNHEQSRNRRCSRRITIGGVTKLQVDWSRESGLSPVVIRARMERGITGENLLAPVSGAVTRRTIQPWSDANAAAKEKSSKQFAKMIRALGGGGLIAPILWPNKSLKSARRRLIACLDATKRDQLNPEQLFTLMKLSAASGYHEAHKWFNEMTGYTHSEPMEPEDERAKLQRETVQAVAQLTLLTQRLEKLNTATVALRAVAR